MSQIHPVYSIGAHEDCVKDLPLALLLAIRETMENHSWDNDSCASFCIIASMKSPEFALRLWIDHADAQEREDPSEGRFFLSRLTIDTESEHYSPSDFMGFSNQDDFCFFISSDTHDLVEELVKHIPDFKERYDLHNSQTVEPLPFK